MIRSRAVRHHVEGLLDRYSVKRGSSKLPASSLSGGNQQRVAVARELDGDPKILLACQPTRGVDIRGIAFIHQCLLDYRDRGGSVLLISEELDELLELSDRIVVVYGGRSPAKSRVRQDRRNRPDDARRSDCMMDAVGIPQPILACGGKLPSLPPSFRF